MSTVKLCPKMSCKQCSECSALKLDGFIKQPISNDCRYIYPDFKGHFMKYLPLKWFHETGCFKWEIYIHLYYGDISWNTLLKWMVSRNSMLHVLNQRRSYGTIFHKLILSGFYVEFQQQEKNCSVVKQGNHVIIFIWSYICPHNSWMTANERLSYINLY